MARSLVIVESPAKAKTINKYLGRNYSVKASYGHVMDLPKKSIGILLPPEPNGKKIGWKSVKGKLVRTPRSEAKKALKNWWPRLPKIEFEPTYEVIPGKVKVIGELKKAAESAENVYLATDPDREGEAISAHLLEALAKKKSDRGKFYRVMFNEITQKAIRAAFEKPGTIDEHLVDAQQARRVIRTALVGYKVSPCAVGQSAPWAFRGTRADRRSAVDCRAGTRNSRLHSQGVLDHPCAAR